MAIGPVPETSTESPEASPAGRVRDIARDVLVDAFGASATPFVPLPFVDDWLFARLLRRIAKKVLARNASTSGMSPDFARDVAAAYVDAGSPSLGRSVLVGAARFVARKVALVLDVKKSHDLFGESIAFAVGLDIAAGHGWFDDVSAKEVGAALYRTLRITSPATLDAMVRSGREAFANMSAHGPTAPVRTRAEHLADALAGQIDALRLQIEPVLRGELTVRSRTRG